MPINLADEFDPPAPSAPAKVNLADEFQAPVAPAKVDLASEFEAAPATPAQPVMSDEEYKQRQDAGEISHYLTQDQYQEIKRKQESGELPREPSELGQDLTRLSHGLVTGDLPTVGAALGSKSFRQQLYPAITRNVGPMVAAIASDGMSLIPTLGNIVTGAMIGENAAETQEIQQGLRKDYSPREHLAAGLTAPLFAAAPIKPNAVVPSIVQGAAEGALFTGASGAIGGRDVSTDDLLASALLGAGFRGIHAVGNAAQLQEQVAARARELGYAGNGKMDDIREWYKAATARPVSAVNPEAANPHIVPALIPESGAPRAPVAPVESVTPPVAPVSQAATQIIKPVVPTAAPTLTQEPAPISEPGLGVTPAAEGAAPAPASVPAAVESASAPSAPSVGNSQPAPPLPSVAGTDVSRSGAPAEQAGPISQPTAGSTPAPAPTLTEIPATLPPVAQLNAKGLPDRIKGDPRGRDDKFGIVLMKDGVAYGRKVLKTGGQIKVQDAGDLLPRAGKSDLRSLADLKAVGFTVQHEPFQLAQAAPDFKVTATPEAFDRWVGQGIAKKQEVRAAIREGAQHDVILKTLADADPDTALGLMAVQDVVANASGGSYAHTILGLTQRVDSKGKGQLDALAASKKLAAAKSDPSSLLWKKNGKIFGLFNADEWQGVKELAAMGDNEGVSRLLQSKLTTPGASAQANAKAVEAWSRSVAEEGQRKQAGDAAYAGKGAGQAKPVDRSLDKPLGTENGDASLSDVMADPNGDKTGDIPLTSGKGETVEETRAALQRTGLTDDEIDFVMGEMGEATPDEVVEIMDLAKSDELQGFFAKVRKADNPRALLADAVDQFLDHHETLLSSEQAARSGAGQADQSPAQAGRTGREETPGGQSGNQVQTLTHDQIAGHLPTVNAVPDSIGLDGRITREPRLVNGPDGVSSNIGAGLMEARRVSDSPIARVEDPVARARVFDTHRKLQAEFVAVVEALGARPHFENDQKQGQAVGEQSPVRFKELDRSPLSVGIDSNGTITVTLRDNLFDSIWAGVLDDAAFTNWAKALFNEEQIHVAQLVSMRNDWLKQSAGTRGTFTAFVEQRTRTMLAGVRDSLTQMPQAKREIAKTALLATWHTYFNKELEVPSDSGAVQILNKLVSPELVSEVAQNPNKFIFEFARQLLQIKRSGTISEVALLSPLQRIKEWVLGGIKALRGTSAMAQQGDLGDGLKAFLDRTEAVLDGREASIPTGLPVMGDASLVLEAGVAARQAQRDAVDRARVQINQTLAALNSRIATEAKAQPALAKLGRSLEWFREQFGLSDPVADHATATTQTAAGGQSVPGINPSQKLADFKDRASRFKATQLAHATLQKDLERLGGTIIKDTADLAKLERDLAKKVSAEGDLHHDYLNAEGLAPIIRRGVARFVVKQLRAMNTVGFKQGELMQLVRQLDANALDRNYAGAFQKLARNKDLTGRNLFDLLDTLVNQANIDFAGRTIVEIRQAIAERVAAHPDKTELGLLVQNTSESRALLAGLTAYAKTNAQMLAKIAQRKMKSAEERLALQAKVEKIMTGAENVPEALRGIQTSAKLEERARAAYQQVREDALRLSRQVELKKARIAAAGAVIPEWSRTLRELGNEIGVMPHIGFADGLVVNIPPTPTATAKEIDAATMQLKLSGEVTAPGVIREARWKLKDFLEQREAEARSNPDALDDHYWRAKAHLAALNDATWTSPANRKVDVLTKALWMQAATRKAESLGLASGRYVSQLITQYGGMHKVLERKFESASLKVEHTLREAMNALAPISVLKAGRGMSAAQFKALFEQPAKAALANEKALLETHTPEQAERRVMQQLMNRWLTNPLTEKWVRGAPEHQQAVAEKMLAFLRADQAASRARVAVNEEHGLGVRDASIKVQLPDGTFADGIRDALPDGVMTFSRTQAEGVPVWVNRMRGLGWGEGWKTAIKDAKAAYADGTLRAKLAPFFDQDGVVAQKFLRAIATATASPLDAPAIGGFTPKADAGIMAEAWAQAGGDVVTFLEKAHALHGGQGDVGSYVESQLVNLGQLYAKLDEMNPVAGVPGDNKGSLFHDLMIDSRTLTDWPDEWFEYARHDRQTSFSMNQRQAAQIAFGRDGEKIKAAMGALSTEVKAQLETYKAWVAEAERAESSKRGVAKAVRERFVAKLGMQAGTKEYNRLKVLAAREGQVGAINKDIERIFQHDPYTWTAATGYLVSGAVEGFTTAIGQFAEVYNALQAHGVSAASIKEVGHAIGYLGEDFAHAFMDFLGNIPGLASAKTMLPMSEEARLYLEEMGIDPRAERTFFDAFAGHKMSPATILLRAIPAVRGITVTGKAPRGTAIAPLAPFSTVNTMMHANNVKNTWRKVAKLVGKVVEFYRTPEGRAALADPAFAVTADTLGLTGFAKQEFENLTHAMTDGYDLHLADMARGAIERGADTAKRGELLTNKERARLYALVLQNITMEQTPANMAAAAGSNGFAKVTLPLMGWGIRRAQQAARIPLNAEGERNWKSFNHGLATLVAAAVGSIGLAFLMEAFDEDALRKKRNARSVKNLPGAVARGDVGEALMTLQEVTARTGTLGMWSDAINTGLSMGNSDVRPFSFDQRVLMAHSLLSMIDTLGRIKAQDGTVDYAGIIRPFMQSTGMSSTIQLMQLVNTAGDAAGTGPVFGDEEAITRRLNATNWLREAGKLANIPTRTYGAGGGFTATPLTPWITKMTMAAYGNDRVEFVAAWRQAIQTAAKTEAGKADPVTYVRDQFANKNPLKQVFGSISEDNYSLLLSKLPGSGRVDVQNALRYFNAYAESLDAKAYYGSSK